MTDRPALSYAAVAVTLELSRLRSSLRVGMALVQRFPQEDDWWALLDDPEIIDSLNALAEVVNDMRVDTAEATTAEEVAAGVAAHHDRAVEAVSLVAEVLGVPSEDLLAVLAEA
jgi:hypothetical protein